MQRLRGRWISLRSRGREVEGGESGVTQAAIGGDQEHIKMASALFDKVGRAVGLETRCSRRSSSRSVGILSVEDGEDGRARLEQRAS